MADADVRLHCIFLRMEEIAESKSNLFDDGRPALYSACPFCTPVGGAGCLRMQAYACILWDGMIWRLRMLGVGYSDAMMSSVGDVVGTYTVQYISVGCAVM